MHVATYLPSLKLALPNNPIFSPKAAARVRWLDQRRTDLLPVEYFHVVFTMPSQIASIALQNKRVIYDILFRAAAENLTQVGADERHLGAKLGFFAVLHTWGQNLQHHPHVHCVIPGGGLRDDGQWVSCPKGFFLPVRALARLYRGKFLSALKSAHRRDEIQFHGSLAELRDPGAFREFLDPLYSLDWFVYAKPPFGGPAHVLRYLSRYTHRVAISNRRLTRIDDQNVSFRFRGYARGCRLRTLTIPGTEFLRRFLTHTLPRGFVRIRHFGLLANRQRRVQLERCREAIAHAESPGEMEVPTSE